MSAATPTTLIVYPDSDGLPMSDNTVQFRLIVTIQGNLDLLFRADPNVFVAGDLLWYPVEGDDRVRRGPDVMVAFGRPKGDRGSYRQWEEGGVPPQVVFEVRSPGDRRGELNRKFEFYNQYGVEEYYLLDPDRNTIEGYVRGPDGLDDIRRTDGWVSPRLGVRFGFGPDEPRLFNPDGSPFLSFVELGERAAAEHERASAAAARADGEAARAVAAEARAAAERERAERLAARLRELGIDPGAV